ncbi:multidrug ABC transporter ATP-binding protein [Planctomycetota bacterium]|nr:multidrug ABC transporter ATP-binding protein [Planctomycetota bacterium]
MSRSDAPLLDARGLVKDLGGKRVVDGVDLHCRAGEVLGLLGPNGAGKTTTLRMCYGFLRPDAGAITIAGHSLATDGDRARRSLGVCTQDDTYDSDFSVRGNLEQTARYYRPRIDQPKERIDELLRRFGLEAFAQQKPDTLSGGYKRRLMIARSIVHSPQLVFLDEPTTGLDPQARVAVWELIASLREAGLGVVLTTHYMDEAERLSDRLLVLQAGKVRASGAAKSVLGDVVGEHIVVLPVLGLEADAAAVTKVQDWLSRRGQKPAQVLNDWHLPFDGPGLAAFVAAFPELRYEVRAPTLDDLFLTLAGEGPSS